MITRSRASYVSALDPSCPVKSEEPLHLVNYRARERGVELVFFEIRDVHGTDQA